ncbi:MAG: TlyA family RNA methyltransferase [Candidatus Saccharibacteria bacterium]|nr:TlyA family RNA methyltransferase [Candidatus Saccharibacteria bacterium]
MKRQRLDQAIVAKGLIATRSQAESYIKLGHVSVDKQVVRKPGQFVTDGQKIDLKIDQQYVSRAGLKLAAVADKFQLNFHDKVVLDVGSSTGGFTDYALRHGAKKVIAVDVGTNQLHPNLRTNPNVELHEQTDIRNVRLRQAENEAVGDEKGVHIDIPDIIVIDVSFISLRDVLPHVSMLMSPNSILVAMAKPQFEAQAAGLKHRGVIKNDKMRRETLQHLESWIKKLFIIAEKADSEIAGAKGNQERFYLLKKTQ